MDFLTVFSNADWFLPSVSKVSLSWDPLFPLCPEDNFYCHSSAELFFISNPVHFLILLSPIFKLLLSCICVPVPLQMWHSREERCYLSSEPQKSLLGGSGLCLGKCPCKPVDAANWDPEKKRLTEDKVRKVAESSWIHDEQRFVDWREGEKRNWRREEGEGREKVTGKLTEK